MTNYQLGQLMANNLPPQNEIKLVDLSTGQEFTPVGVTYHPAEGGNPQWGSIDFETSES